MLTKDDVKIISDLMDQKFDNFARIVKRSLDSKPDREEMEERFDILENRMDTFENKLDILSFRVEQNHSRRIEILEDDMRQMKTKLKME